MYLHPSLNSSVGRALDWKAGGPWIESCFSFFFKLKMKLSKSPTGQNCPQLGRIKIESKKSAR